MTLIDFCMNQAKIGWYLHSRAHRNFIIIRSTWGKNCYPKWFAHRPFHDVNGLRFSIWQMCTFNRSLFSKCQSNHTKNTSYYNQIRYFIYMSDKRECERRERRRRPKKKKKQRATESNARTRDNVRHIGICCAFHTFIPFGHSSIGERNSQVGYSTSNSFECWIIKRRQPFGQIINANLVSYVALFSRSIYQSGVGRCFRMDKKTGRARINWNWAKKQQR